MRGDELYKRRCPSAGNRVPQVQKTSSTRPSSGALSVFAGLLSVVVFACVVGCHAVSEREVKRKVRMSAPEIKQLVKDRYGRFAETGGSRKRCCPAKNDPSSAYATEEGLYHKDELSLIPKIAIDLSRGCGNPCSFAHLEPGEVVVDFGCGGGIDVILAAHKVGVDGKVVGIDFAPQMIERARQAVAKAGLQNRDIEFHVGDIEELQLPDAFADVVMSNCTINLCPNKNAVYKEAFRILRPGGRIAISDIVLTENIDPDLQERFQLTWAGCLGGAIAQDDYLHTVKKAKFVELRIVARRILTPEELEGMASCPGEDFAPAPAKEDLARVRGKVVSIKFTARKPLLK